MVRTGAWRSLVCAAIALGLVSCKEQPDDQTNIKREHKVVADPVPVSADGKVERFATNNAKHKILLGVFDTGVDYNHPVLRDHIHFELDKDGKPISAGIDFLTEEDKWASHRLIETSLYEYEALTERQQRHAKYTHKSKKAYEDNRRRNVLGRFCGLDELLKMDPKLGRYVHGYRDMDRELAKAQHGTHVAGLMSYDNDAIGLIPYRVLPYHQTEDDEAAYAEGKADKFVENFEKAVKDASQKGVRIVNLSLGGSFKKPSPGKGTNYEADAEKFRNLVRLVTKGLQKIVEKYPDVLFVAAAGNDGGWSDNEVRLQYPCGVEAQNILCVGALDKDGTKTDFTNIPLNDIDLVFASGKSVISTVPHDGCHYLSAQLDVIFNQDDWKGLCRYDNKTQTWVPDKFRQRDVKELVATIHKYCAKPQKLYDAFSGTSMATPIVARMAAEVWLADMKLRPQDVVAKLKDRAIRTKTKTFETFHLTASRPTWYALFHEREVGEGNAPTADKYLKAGPAEIILTFLPENLRGWFDFLVTQ